MTNVLQLRFAMADWKSLIELHVVLLQRVEHSIGSLKDNSYQQTKQNSFLAKTVIRSLANSCFLCAALTSWNQSDQVASFILAPVCGSAYMLSFCLHISSDGAGAHRWLIFSSIATSWNKKRLVNKCQPLDSQSHCHQFPSGFKKLTTSLSYQ